MTDLSKSELLDSEVWGKTLRRWNACWKPLSGGFQQKHPELRSDIGLARALLNSETMYILQATEHKGGGIEKGLQRIRGPEQTGNSGYGAQMIRQHIDDVELEVLLVGVGPEAVQTTEKLKEMMIEYYDPKWNEPYRRRTKAIIDGNIN